MPLAHGARDGRYADGGVGAMAPIGPAVRQGALQLEVCLLGRAGTERWTPSLKAVDQAGRAVEILRDQLYWSDLDATVTRNRLAAASRNTSYQQIDGRTWEPLDVLPGWMDWSEAAKRRRRVARFRLLGSTLDQAHIELERRRVTALAASLAH